MPRKLNSRAGTGKKRKKRLGAPRAKPARQDSTTAAPPAADSVVATATAPVVRRPPPSPPRPQEEQAWYDLRYNALLQKLYGLRDHYRHSEIPPHTLAKAQKVLSAASHEEVEPLALKAEESMLMACLAAWSRGDIKGPKKVEDPFNLEQEAKKCESRAKMLKKKGDSDGYKDQMMKAIELRERIKELTGILDKPT